MRFRKANSLQRKELPGQDLKKSKQMASHKPCFSPAFRLILPLKRADASWSLPLVLAVLMVSCSRVTVPISVGKTAPETVTRFAPVSEAFRIVAYATEGIADDQIPYGKLTHINYSFLIPNADGTFQPIGNSVKLRKIVESAHRHNVNVSIAVGGWGWDSQFEEMASKPDARAAFVLNLQRLVRDFGLDGMDIDWEYPEPGQSSQNFLALIRELRAAFPGKILTAAVVSHGNANGMGIPAESFAPLDFVNIMTYDGPEHGTMEHFNKGLIYWKGRGLPQAKMVMGVPFYSRVKGSPGESAPFARLVAANPAAANADTFELSGARHSYNGIPTIQQKTRVALESAGGIMFWVLDADAPGDLSLVNAIYQIAHPN
jgi:chitinase